MGDRKSEIKQRIDRKLIEEVCAEQGITDETIMDELEQECNEVSENSDVIDDAGVEEDITENANDDDGTIGDDKDAGDIDEEDEVIRGIIEAQTALNSLSSAVEDPIVQNALTFADSVINHVSKKYDDNSIMTEEETLLNAVIIFLNTVSEGIGIEIG